MPDSTEREAAIRLAASRLRDSLGVPIADARFLLDQLDAARRERDEARELLGRLVAALSTDDLTDYDDIDEIGDEAAALLNLERSRH